MARLSAEEWSDIRAEWEASPNPGFAWMCKDKGGSWPVTDEAIRQRRKAEGWAKRGTLASVVEKAQLRADAASQPAEAPKLGQLGRQVGEAEAKKEADHSARVEDIAVDLRAKLIERHRAEWATARNLSYEATKTKDFEKAKLAKITAEALRIIQDGERKAWGLDVVADVRSMTDAQLEAIAKGRMPS